MCRIHIIGINIWSFWRSFYLFLYCKFVYCWLFVYFEWKYNFFDIFISLNMFYKTSFLMKDSRSKKKWDTGTGFKGQFYFERSFFSIKKSLKASRKYHKISLSEPSGDSKKWVPSILVSWHAWCCFSNFLKTFIRRTDLYVESFNPFIIMTFLFLIGYTNCWFILFNMDKFQVDLV